MSRAAESRIETSALFEVTAQEGFQFIRAKQTLLNQAFETERVSRRADRQSAIGQLQQPQETLHYAFFTASLRGAFPLMAATARNCRRGANRREMDVCSSWKISSADRLASINSIS